MLILEFQIPETLVNKVPRHWLTFVEDAMAEIADLKLEKYEVRLNLTK